MKLLKYFNSIKTKMILLLGTIILVVSIGMGLMSHYISSQALISNLEQMLPELAKESAVLIESNIAGSFELLDMIIYNIKDSKLTEEDKRKKLKIQEVKGKYLLLGIADLKGILTTADEKKIDISELDTFQKALEGEQTVSEPIQDSFSISGLTDSTLVIVYANPIKVSGKVESILIAVKSGNDFSTLVNDITFGKTGRAFMINDEGEMIAHHNLSFVFDKTNFIKEAAGDHSLKQLAAMLERMKEGKLGSGNYTYNGAKMYAGYAPIGSTGWSIAIAGESDEMLSGLNKLGSISVIFSLFFLVLGVIAVLLITTSITKGLIIIVRSISRMADGDLTLEVPEYYRRKNDEIGILANSLSKMQCFIRDMIDNIQNSSANIDGQSENLSEISRTVTAATDNVATAIQDVAKGAGEQAGELSNMLVGINHFSTELSNVVHLIHEIENNANSINSMAEDSSKEMKILAASSYVIYESFRDFMFKISTLSDNVKKVNEIANSIKGIADQTNLLSLNAAIEAARAGESGRGFAVVADHIRSLADQTKSLSASINIITNGVCHETENMVGTTKTLGEEFQHQIEILNNTTSSFDKMMNAFQIMAPEIEAVNVSAYELDRDKNAIIGKIEGVASIAEQVSASAEEIAASAEEMNASMEEIASSSYLLNDMTKKMQKQVDLFRVSDGHGAEVPAIDTKAIDTKATDTKATD